MAQEHSGAFCSHCNKFTMHIRDLPEVHHVVHALITIFTCGCWALVWLLFAASAQAGEWTCGQCGCKWQEPAGEVPFQK